MASFPSLVDYPFICCHSNGALCSLGFFFSFSYAVIWFCLHKHKLTQFFLLLTFFFVFSLLSHCIGNVRDGKQIVITYMPCRLQSAATVTDCASVFYFCFFSDPFFSLSRFLFVTAVNKLCIQYKCSERLIISNIQPLNEENENVDTWSLHFAIRGIRSRW